MKWFAALVFAPLLTAEPITFTKDIAPLIFHYCSPCHRPREAAPFSLLTYEDARKHAAQIVSVTRKRYMPPWLPEADYGDFDGERRLSADQLHTLAEWVAKGAPEGDPSALPAAPHFTEGWQMGPPDMIVRTSAPYRLQAGGGDVFRNLVITPNLKEAKYIRAVELRPGNKRAVHHANLLLDHRQSLRKRDGLDGQPGFPGMETVPEPRSDSWEPDSHFLFWKPGTVLKPEPDDMSWRLDPETDLIFNLHLRPSGKEETIQPVVGLYFASHPPGRHPMLLQLEHDGALDIPPGSKNFTVTDRATLPVGVEVLAIYPHAHYLGKRIEAWATLPDGALRWLIKIADWDINWQAVFTYRKPVWLPKGSTIEMRITYDNSDSNPRNPNHPPKRVRTGPRSEDEMGHVWLQVLPKKESADDPRLALQEAMMRRRLEKYPDDFIGHYNLGVLLTLGGKYSEAIPDFTAALRMQPSSASARNGLGAGLLAVGRVDEAIRELTETLRVDPAHINGRWNLARALLVRGDLDAAAGQLEIFLKQKPDDADAQFRLGVVYFRLQRLGDALPHLQKASTLKPGDDDIQTNLGALLASRGDLNEAIQAFQAALILNPKNAAAGAYLKRTQADLERKRKNPPSHILP